MKKNRNKTRKKKEVIRERNKLNLNQKICNEKTAIRLPSSTHPSKRKKKN